MHFDAIVVGTGGMGSAAADALAGRGRRVLAVEQFGVAHDRGSSHGRTRIVRQAYFENPAYIPLLRRAYELWDTLPPAVGIHRVGCLSLGAASSPVVTGAARSAAEWGIEIEQLSAAQVRDRFPQFRPRAGDEAVFEPDAGFVRPEETVRLYTERARARGAEILTGHRVTGWEQSGAGVRVAVAGVDPRTGESTADVVTDVTADHLVLTAGAWTPTLAPVLGLSIHVERRVMHFFAPREPAMFAPGPMPTFIWDLADNDSIYGFPADGADGVKIGFHNRGGPADPDRPQPPATPAEATAMRAVLEERLPSAAGPAVRSVGCLYDLTPDHDFTVGLAPGTADRVVFAAGTSGHGFKFVPALGELLADLVITGECRYDLDFLRPGRFADRSLTHP